mgnify:CR=1 FL=1
MRFEGKDINELSVQERNLYVEYHKWKFQTSWFSKLTHNKHALVLNTKAGFGYLGSFNSNLGTSPFERFYLGGDGLGSYSLDGRESIALRGYPNQSLSDQDGGTIYNKFSLELRYPITLKASAKIFALGFLEGGASYNNFRDYNPFSIKRSAGLGIRIFMPAFGLLGIDFGHRFDDIPGQPGSSNTWETHFIIGQQF